MRAATFLANSYPDALKPLQGFAAGGGQLQHRTQRDADFSQHAIGMLTKDPGLLNLVGLTALRQTGVRNTLMPKLVAQTDDGKVAIDVRAPDVTASRTLATGAALIAARVAVLRLRFERVIVALPEKAEPYAVETLKLLKAWAVEPAPVLASLDFLLIGDDSARPLQKPGL